MKGYVVNEYRVEWTMIIEAESALDAALQAWGMLDDATSTNTGPTGLYVSDIYGNNKVIIDMETALNYHRGTAEECERIMREMTNGDRGCANPNEHRIPLGKAF